MIGTITRKLTATALFALSVSMVPVQAADYPKGNISFIVPFPPGGGTDISARQLTQQIGESTGWNFVVENRPGAGGNIGLAQLARASSDGQTLAIGQTSNLAVNPSLYKDIPYDSKKDFRHIAVISTQPMVIVARSDSPIKDLPGFLADAKSEPGRLLFGTPGSGTVAHLSLELLQNKAGIEMTHVPYPGIAQAISDVMGGVVDIYIGSMPSVLPHIRAGSLRPLAVTSLTRASSVPDLPTLDELGLKGFQAVAWNGLTAPARTPKDVIAKIADSTVRIVKSPELAEQLKRDGSDPVGSSTAEFVAHLRSEVEKWKKVLERAGITSF